MILADALRAATGGGTINDGLLSWYRARGATGATLMDAENQWLRTQLGVTDTAVPNGDLWRMFTSSQGLTGTTLEDLLYAFWNAVADGSWPPVPSAGLLSGALGNVIQNNRETQAFSDCCIRWPFLVGSGSLSSIAFRFDAWYLSGSNSLATNLGNDIPITEAYAEYNGTAVQIRWGGATTKTITNGDADVLTDEIAASAFGVSAIPRGAIVYIKLRVSFPNTTSYLPTSTRNGGGSGVAGASINWINPAAVTASAVSATGVFTFSPTTTGAGFRSQRSGGLSPVMLGRYVESNVKVWLFVGDSITAGTGDTTGGTPRMAGFGWPGIACADMDGGNPVSYLNIAVHGSSTVALAQGVKYESYAKYANRLEIMYGTNDLGTGASAIDPVPIETRIAAGVLALQNTAGSQLVPAKRVFGFLLPRTTSIDSWATGLGQTYQSQNWGVLGASAIINLWIDLQTGGGYLRWNGIRDLVDGLKWNTNSTANWMTGDGTHPNTAAYTIMATEAKAVLMAAN